MTMLVVEPSKIVSDPPDTCTVIVFTPLVLHIFSIRPATMYEKGKVMVQLALGFAMNTLTPGLFPITYGVFVMSTLEVAVDQLALPDASDVMR